MDLIGTGCLKALLQHQFQPAAEGCLWLCSLLVRLLLALLCAHLHIGVEKDWGDLRDSDAKLPQSSCSSSISYSRGASNLLDLNLACRAEFLREIFTLVMPPSQGMGTLYSGQICKTIMPFAHPPSYSQMICLESTIRWLLYPHWWAQSRNSFSRFHIWNQNMIEYLLSFNCFFMCNVVHDWPHMIWYGIAPIFHPYVM